MPTKHRRKHHGNNPLPSVPPTTTTTSVLLPPINANPSPPTPTGTTAIPTSPFLSSGTAAAPPTPLERTNTNMKECDNGMGSDVDEDDDDGVASTGARTTLGTYSTLSILSNDGVLPYDIGGATDDAVHSCLLLDEARVINSTTTATTVGNEQHHNSQHRHNQSQQHHQPVVLTSSALLVSVPSTPLSAASSIPFPNHHHRHHSSSVYRPVPLFSNMKLETATHLANVKRSTVLSECMAVDGVDEALLAESSQSPYVHTPHPKPPSLVSPVGAMGTPASSPSKLLSDKTTTSSISAAIPPTPVVGQTLKYQATREWVGTAPDPTAGGAGALSPDSLHLSITSRTNTLIAAGFDLIGGGGGDTSPNALSGGSAWNAELEFDWASCSPGGESSARNQQHQPGAHISTSPSGCRSNSNGDGVAVGGGGMGVYTTYSRCTSALSEPTSGVERLDENAAKLPTLPHYRPPSFSREASEQQLGETASTASGMSNNHPRVRVPAIPTILAGACPDQPPEPQDDLSEEDREAILNNNRSPPLYLLNRQMQAQQLLQCYLAFSAAEKLFGSARVSYATGGKGSDPLKRNRFLVSAAAAASAFHMFGGGALAGHPTAASLAAANFRSVFAAAAALQSSSSSLKQQGVVPPSKINTTTGKNILSSVLYGHSSNQTQYAGSMSAAFSVPGFHNISNPAAGGGAAAAQKRAAAMRAVPLSPDQERNTYFPLHNTNSAATVTTPPMGHSKRIEPSKLDRQPLPARTTMPSSSYPTPNTTAAVPAVNTTSNHAVNDDDDNDDDDSLSDVFGGDSFDTWVSGVVLQSQGHLISTNNISTNILPSPNQRHNPTVSKLRTNEEIVDDQSSEGAVLVDHPDDSSSLANHQQFVNQPHEKFSAVMKQPFARRGGDQLPQRVMSWNSGLSTSKARTDDWDVLSPSQQFRQQHRPNTEYDVCSVSPSAASGTTRQQATQNAAQLVLGSNPSSGVVVGRIGDLSSSTVSAAAQSTASPIIPPRRGGGGAAAFSSAEPISPTPRTAQQQPVSLSGGGGVGMKRVASSWASISSGGRKAAPNVDASYASSAAVHQYQMDDF